MVPGVDPVSWAVVTLLAPHLGELLKTGGEKLVEKLAEGVAEAAGGKMLDKVAQVWGKLRGKVEADPGLRTVAELVGKEPRNEAFQQTLASLVGKLLAQDTALRAEVAGVVNISVEASGNSTVVQAFGPSAQANQTTVNNFYFLQFTQVVAPALPGIDLEAGMRQYQKNLLAWHQHLEFRGMGFNERLPLRLPLMDVYLPGRAHRSVPAADTADRHKPRLRGLEPDESERESLGRHTELRELEALAREFPGVVVLGDPGSGKTTFLKYLALRLALGQGEELGLGERLPVLASLATYARRVAEKPGLSVESFLAERLAADGVPAAAEVLAEGLAKGRMVVLLDGLDEVRTTASRQSIARSIQRFFQTEVQRGNRLVVTSRIVGYREVRINTEGVAECTLTDLELEDIGRFLAQWTEAVEKTGREAGEVATIVARRERDALLSAIKAHESIRRLAGNPLLLTILALVKRQGVELPRERAALYHQYVEVLILHWNLARSLGEEPGPELDLRETIRLLGRIALRMQGRSAGRSEIAEGDLLDQLASCFGDPAEPATRQAAERFLGDIRRETSLLIDRGGGRFGFIHPTFQEYLAAVALVDRAQLGIAPLVEELSKRIPDPAWREVCLLAVAELARERDEAAGAVLEALLDKPPGKPGEAQVFVGQAAWNAGEKLLPADVRQRVVKTLLETMGDSPRVAAVTRVEAGEALALLGDPREEVTTLAGMQFCTVPAGPFWFGEGGFIRQVELPCFAMARFPVTVAQFQEYVDRAHGGVWPGNEDALRGPANTPVVRVIWREATAFCEWLTKTWRAEGRIQAPTAVFLPSEVQWEKAARGGLEVPAAGLAKPWAVGSSSAALVLVRNPAPKRKFPWEGDFEADRANSEEAGVGWVSPVGCFSRGQSPYAIQDLAGNVREQLTDSEDARILLLETSLTRGGCYFLAARNARCAHRERGLPSFMVGIGFRLLLFPFPL